MNFSPSSPPDVLNRYRKEIEDECTHDINGFLTLVDFSCETPEDFAEKILKLLFRRACRVSDYITELYDLVFPGGIDTHNENDQRAIFQFVKLANMLADYAGNHFHVVTESLIAHPDFVPPN